MLYLYRTTASEGARELEDTLNDLGTPTRFTQGRLLRERFRTDRDRLVCWGSPWPQVQGALNNVAPVSKFTEAATLAQANVATIRVSRQRPQVQAATRGRYERPAINATEYELPAIVAHMQAWMAAPLPPAEVWVARRNDHVGGNDLLRDLAVGDYWSRKEDIAQEYRLHIFQGKSIRAGQKIHREDFPSEPHPWVRSFEAGWRINYNGFQSTRAMRELAAAAVQALGLDFGAVDLAQRPDGTLFVLEVNRAPGVEAGTAVAYAQAIQRWLNPASMEEAA